MLDFFYQTRSNVATQRLVHGSTKDGFISSKFPVSPDTNLLHQYDTLSCTFILIRKLNVLQVEHNH